MLGLIVAVVLCNIKEVDVDSLLSDVSDEDSDVDSCYEDEEDEDGTIRRVRLLTKREILFDMYVELKVLDVCVGIEERMKLMETSAIRRKDETVLMYIKKTLESISLIQKWHEREVWKQENPDSDDD